MEHVTDVSVSAGSAFVYGNIDCHDMEYRCNGFVSMLPLVASLVFLNTVGRRHYSVGGLIVGEE